MKKLRLLIALVASVFAFSVLGSFAGANSDASVRIVHASPDAPAVDVYVNGDLVVENAPFKAATDYLQVPAGTHNVEIFVAGTQEDPVITADLTVEAGVAYTVAAINTVENLELTVITDDNAVAEGQSKIRVGHLSPDAPTVDVGLIGGDTVFAGAPFKAVTDYVTLDAGTYDLEVRLPDGGAQVIDLSGTTLEANTVYTVFAVNTVENIETLVLVDNTMVPSEMPQTGMGGASTSNNMGLIAITVLAIAGAIIIGGRKIATQK